MCPGILQRGVAQQERGLDRGQTDPTPPLPPRTLTTDTGSNHSDKGYQT